MTTGEISSVSNVFSFKTLRIPSIRVISIKEDSVRLRVNIECRLRFSGTPDDVFKSTSGEETNYLFRIMIHKPSSPDWMNSYEKLLQELDFSGSTQDPAYRLFSTEIEIRNLNSSVIYLVKLEHEISMVSDEFYTPPYVITSNVIKFATFEKS